MALWLTSFQKISFDCHGGNKQEGEEEFGRTGRPTLNSQTEVPQMESPALSLLTLVWEQGMQDSWGRINHSMRSALRLAISAGLAFKAADFATIYGRFRGGYWVGSEPEWIYAAAVSDCNRSAFGAWEEFKGRKPFFANTVTAYSNGGFIHTSTVNRDRERLAVGFGFRMDGSQWFCTGFADDYVRVALYEHDYRDGKPKRLLKLTRENLAVVCPAPKKPRKVPSMEPKATKSDSASS